MLAPLAFFSLAHRTGQAPVASPIPQLLEASERPGKIDDVLENHD